jgi:alginate O-acetyltransferase complex protein AlgI
MLFNSFEYLIFLPSVFVLYWFVFPKSLRIQNLLLIIAGYTFYGWWDWRFLFLLTFSSTLDYIVGILLGKIENPSRRKLIFSLSLAANLGFLGFFKYYNFFVDSFISAFSFLGLQLHARTLNIILPVGISFYTFQALSYTIEVYRKKIEPTKDIITFFAFISFFPPLLAGPIERASHMIPQFCKKRIFNYADASDGMRQILWGLLKKIVIADSCAMYVNDIFSHYKDYSGSTLLVGAILFSFQIYGDFSGYSDIALGSARLFGFKLMRNFALPYFSRDIAEFWRRWHISLSSWFRDYVYIPLGGSRVNTYKKIRNTFIIFILSGLWHGANWTFIAWGALNALYILPLLLSRKNRNNIDIVAKGKNFPSFQELGQIILTFTLTSIAWIFFRAESMSQAISYIMKMADIRNFSIPDVLPIKVFLLIAIFIFIEWLQRDKEHALQIAPEIHAKPLRWSIYYFVVLIIYFFGNFSSNFEFIYFQF